MPAAHRARCECATHRRSLASMASQRSYVPCSQRAHYKKFQFHKSYISRAAWRGALHGCCGSLYDVPHQLLPAKRALLLRMCTAAHSSPLPCLAGQHAHVHEVVLHVRRLVVVAVLAREVFWRKKGAGRGFVEAQASAAHHCGSTPLCMAGGGTHTAAVRHLAPWNTTTVRRSRYACKTAPYSLQTAVVGCPSPRRRCRNKAW